MNRIDTICLSHHKRGRDFPTQGRIQEFWKGGPVRGQSPELSAEGASAGGGSGGPPPENFEKLDAISCNWHIFLRSEWPRISFKIGPLQNKKQ